MPNRSLGKSLRQALSPSPQSQLRQPRRVVVVGVGSSLRADDAAGLDIARRLAERSLPDLHVLVGDTAPENVTGEIRRMAPTHVLFVDAADFGAEPGSLRLFEAAELGGMTSSTHTLPLHVIADYLTKEIGCRVSFLGLQPRSVAFGGPMSSEVIAAVEEAAAAIVDVLR